MNYMIWRRPIGHPYATEAWEGDSRRTYRWHWLARFIAWQRTKAGWTDYVAVPVGDSPLNGK